MHNISHCLVAGAASALMFASIIGRRDHSSFCICLPRAVAADGRRTGLGPGFAGFVGIAAAMQAPARLFRPTIAHLRMGFLTRSVGARLVARPLCMLGPRSLPAQPVLWYSAADGRPECEWYPLGRILMSGSLSH